MAKFITDRAGFLSFAGLSDEDLKLIDGFMAVIERSGVLDLFDAVDPPGSRGRPRYNPANLLAAVLFGFALGRGSLRDLENLGRYDIRAMYILGENSPSHETFMRFINAYITPNRERIFGLLNTAIAEAVGLDLGTAFLDGTKHEADANRYKFVFWPGLRWERLTENFRRQLSVLGIDLGIEDGVLLGPSTAAAKLDEFASVARSLGIDLEPEGRGRGHSLSAEVRAYRALQAMVLKVSEYSEIDRICGPDRNSYYRTDHDATAMALKEDYYSGLGSSMRAAYNVQSLRAGFLFAAYDVSQSRNDCHRMIPTLEMYYRLYGRYPDCICADSAYGTKRNYEYCREHGIEAYVKFQAWEGEMSGRNPCLVRWEDGRMVCLGGRDLSNCPDDGRGRYGTQAMCVEDCGHCPFAAWCRRNLSDPEARRRMFHVDVEAEIHLAEARERLRSVEGIRMRVNRSIMVEGGFGLIKQDMDYWRARRCGLEAVETEVMLTMLGCNVGILLRFLRDGRRPELWEGGEGIRPEEPRKPSAKRLANRASKVKRKSANERARDAAVKRKKRKISD